MQLKENVSVKLGILTVIVLWLSTATSIVLCCCCCLLCLDMTKCLLTTRGLLAMQLGFYKLNCSLVTAQWTSVAALPTLMRWENTYSGKRKESQIDNNNNNIFDCTA